MTSTPNQDPGRRDPSTARAADGREVRERLLAVHADATAFYQRYLAHSWVPDYLNHRQGERAARL